MVVSRISGAVSYPELSRLEVVDVGYTSDAYELEIMGAVVYIVLGQADFTFKSQYNIVFYPIYLIHKISHDVLRKIGVIEFPADDKSYLDDMGGANLLLRPFSPLIFAYVNAATLAQADSATEPASGTATAAAAVKRVRKKKAAETPADIDKAAANTDEVVPADAPQVAAAAAAAAIEAVATEAEAEDLIKINDAGTDGAETQFPASLDHDADFGKDVVLPTQTSEIASLEKGQYEKARGPGIAVAIAAGPHGKKPVTEPWIQTFMHNKNFGIIDNDGGNDSLFATIRDGLRSQGRSTSIEEMRTKLSDMATKELYDDYVKHYNKYAAPYTRIRSEVAEYNQKLAAVMERASTDQGQRLSASELLKLEAENKGVRAQREESLTKMKHLYHIMETRFGYMKETKGDFARFKTILKTRTFIPDAWTLRALERMYNINVVRLSAPRFADGDLDNVIMCGDEISDSPGLELAMFKEAYKPILFIMASVDERGSYSLITYRAKGALTFAELPYDVRTHILTKCMEAAGGEYAFIPQFKHLLASAPQSRGSSGGGTGGGGGGDNWWSHGGDKNKMKTRDVPILQFYNRAGNEFPGKGAGEYVPASTEHLFVPLSKIPNWRRALSNFAESPFILDGRTWFSVEHYYQGSKFRKHNRDFYMQFSLDSGSDIAKDPLIAKAAGSKTGKFNGRLYRPKAVAIDADYFSSGGSKQAIMDAMEAKFRQNSEMKQILLGTLNAQLYHFQRGEKPILFDNLMKVREKLS